MRPRWAYQGMDFLLTICEPQNTHYLSNEVFEKLKKEMDICISHIIGTSAPTTPENGISSLSPRSSLEQIRSRSRGTSPCTRPTYKSQRSGVPRKTSMEQSSPGTDSIDSSSFRNRYLNLFQIIFAQFLTILKKISEVSLVLWSRFTLRIILKKKVGILRAIVKFFS